MVRNPILDDPEVMLQRQELKAFVAQFGRHPKGNELQAWIAETRRQSQLVTEEDPELQRERQEHLARLEQARKDREEAERARADLIARRVAIRMERPSGYRPPVSVAELMNRIAAGEAFFEDMSLGMEDARPADHYDFEACNFSRSQFSLFSFSKDDVLRGMVAQGAVFEDCDFADGCDCRDADFREATFETVLFMDGSKIRNTSFEAAHFKSSTAVQFDQNMVLRANIKDTQSDWVRLTAGFTGLQQFMNLVFCLGYFAFLFAKVFFFSALGSFQTYLLGQPGMEELAKASGVLEEGIPVWRLVFGGATPTVISVAVAVIILTYQIGRYRLTRQIAPMIEDQRADGRTPAYSEYAGLLTRHRRVQALGYVALAVFAVDFFFALTATVYPINWAALLAAGQG